jgi:hypothetical protein
VADQPETTSSEMTTPVWRRRTAMALAGAGVAALVVIALAVVAVNRAPIAEKIVTDKLAELGLGGSRLAITRLTPWAVEVENLATGPDGTARIARLTAALTWPGWTAPRVGALTLEGVQLQLGYRDGAPDWGDLTPLLAGGGAGGGSGDKAVPLPAVTISDGFVEIDHPDGLIAVSLSGVDLAPQPDGGVMLNRGAFDIVHPMGQATLRAKGTREADGRVALDLELEDAHGAAGPVGVQDASGRLRISGNPADPGTLNAEGTLNVNGLRLPGGMLAGGTVSTAMADGRASVTATLLDDGLGVTLNARAEASPFDLAAAANINARVSAVSFARLALAEGLSGNGSLDLRASGPLGDLMSGDLNRLPPVTVAADLTGIAHPGAPGAWSAKGQAVARVAGDTLSLLLAEPWTISGRAWGGDLGASVTGGAAFGLSPFKLIKAEVGELRLTASKLVAGEASLTGPMAVILTPRNGGVTMAEDAAAGPVAKADFVFEMASPSLTARAGGRTAVLRTAATVGSVTLTPHANGKPGVRLSVSGLNAHVPEFDLEAEGLALTASSRGGADGSWNFSGAAKSMRHTAAAPFSAEAKGHWNPRKWDVEGTLRQTATNLIASFAASENSRSGAGRVRLDTVPLNLAAVPGGLHAFTPLAAPFLKAMTGTVQVSAIGVWDKQGLSPFKVTGSLRGAGITPAASLLPESAKGAVAGIGSLSVDRPCRRPTPLREQAALP